MSHHWIFQGKPDVFDIDTYVSENVDLVWSVIQKHLAKKMNHSDQVFILRDAGRSNSIAVIIA